MLDWPRVLPHKPDRAFHGVPSGITESLVGDGLGKPLDTNDFNGLLAAVGHEERDFPFAWLRNHVRILAKVL